MGWKWLFFSHLNMTKMEEGVENRSFCGKKGRIDITHYIYKSSGLFAFVAPILSFWKNLGFWISVKFSRLMPVLSLKHLNEGSSQSCRLLKVFFMIQQQAWRQDKWALLFEVKITFVGFFSSQTSRGLATCGWRQSSLKTLFFLLFSSLERFRESIEILPGHHAAENSRCYPFFGNRKPILFNENPEFRGV